MIAFYLLILTFIAIVAIFGFDATLRLVAYIDLLYRYQIVKVRMWVLKQKLQVQLAEDRKKLLNSQEQKHGERIL